MDNCNWIAVTIASKPDVRIPNQKVVELVPKLDQLLFGFGLLGFLNHVIILAGDRGKLTLISPKSLNGFLNPTFQGKLVEIANLDRITSLVPCNSVQEITIPGTSSMDELQVEVLDRAVNLRRGDLLHG
jgi:hypothetical protein